MLSLSLLSVLLLVGYVAQAHPLAKSDLRGRAISFSLQAAPDNVLVRKSGSALFTVAAISGLSLDSQTGAVAQMQPGAPKPGKWRFVYRSLLTRRKAASDSLLMTFNNFCSQRSLLRSCKLFRLDQWRTGSLWLPLSRPQH